MKLISSVLIVAGCSPELVAPFVLTDHLAMPADLQVAGELVYSLQYDGSIVATSTVDHSTHTVIPPVREIRANEIPIDLAGYNLAISPDTLFWTSQASGRAEVRRAALDGTGSTVLDSSSTPFHALIAIDRGACWAGASKIVCFADGKMATVADNRAEPRALVADGAMLYFVEPASMHRLGGEPLQGDGGLYAVALAGGDVGTLATGLNDPRALVRAGHHLIWIDSGSRTCVNGLCSSNHDASLHSLDPTNLNGGTFVISEGYWSVDDGLVATADSIYFVAEARLRTRLVAGIQIPGLESLMSNATASCTALAIADSVLYCADHDRITAIEISR